MGNHQLEEDPREEQCLVDGSEPWLGTDRDDVEWVLVLDCQQMWVIE